jgi:hypothetical protein
VLTQLNSTQRVNSIQTPNVNIYTISHLLLSVFQSAHFSLKVHSIITSTTLSSNRKSWLNIRNDFKPSRIVQIFSFTKHIPNNLKTLYKDYIHWLAPKKFCELFRRFIYFRNLWKTRTKNKHICNKQRFDNENEIIVGPEHLERWKIVNKKVLWFKFKKHDLSCKFLFTLPEFYRKGTWNHLCPMLVVCIYF